MKRVPLRDRGQFKARDVMISLLETPVPGTGISYGEMKKRSRLLDLIDASGDERFVDFEDADYDVLRGVMEAFLFATGKRELKAILDDIANAKSPEQTATLKVVEGDAG